MRGSHFAPGKWDLSEALPASSPARLEKFLDELDAVTKGFESIRQELPSMAPGGVVKALSLYEDIFERISRLSSFCYMKYSADTSDQAAKASLDRAEELDAETRNRLLFFRLWWTALPEADARRMVPNNPDHRYFLSIWRELRPYTLDEKVEQAVSIKNTTGFSGWTHHYDKITSGFTFTLKVRGKAREMVVDEVVRLFSSADASLRRRAYDSLLSKYRTNGDVLGEVYRTIVRDWRNENVKLRGYKSPIAPRNLENDVPDSAVRALLKVCRERASVFRDFFVLKAKFLGTRRMTRYDLYAPLGKDDRRVTYGESVKLVIDAFRGFDPKVADLALRVFQRKHVDSSPRKGKRSGAYCMTVVPSVVPYLFLNFAGMTKDVYTIAHESGHAVHSQLSSSHSPLTFHPPLVLAETASVFGEMILFDKFMHEERDAEVKRSVLLDKISSMYGTIGRQAHLVLFEEAAHAAVDSGATVNDLCRLYLSNLRQQFGSAMDVPENFMWEWTYIPHIYHTPFYCYAYAFGNLLSLSLYDGYTREGRGFVPKYLRMLSHGGSEAPSKVLEEVGFDMNSEKFWKGGFDLIERMVGELRGL